MSGQEIQDVADEFVQDHAVPASDAESFVHISLDDAYHPRGGFWFPTGQKWGDASGWCTSKYEIPDGEVIQYPCSDREPEILGEEGLPPWVVNRTVRGDCGE